VLHWCSSLSSCMSSFVYLHHVFVLVASSLCFTSSSSLSKRHLLSLYILFTIRSLFMRIIFPQYLNLISSALAFCLSHPNSPLTTSSDILLPHLSILLPICSCSFSKSTISLAPQISIPYSIIALTRLVHIILAN